MTTSLVRALPSGRSVDAMGATHIACLVCGGPYRPSRLPGLFQCSACGFISADMNVPEKELIALYGKDYFHGEEYLDYVKEEDSLRLNFRDRLALLKPLVPNWPNIDLLEIGCAYGFFLDEVNGELRSTYGIDVCEDAVRYAVEERGVNASHGDYLALDLGRKVDIIAMWDTIEHLKRPDLFVSKAAGDLKPGGLLTITTGDIGSLNAKLRGRRWRLIHPPTHMHYFSVVTLSKLLDRHGFDVVHVSHPGNSRRLRSIVYFILVLRMKRQDIYDRVKSWPLLNWRLTINLFDIMYVIARRRSHPGQDG